MILRTSPRNRTRILRLEGACVWLPASWPPRSRTARYLFIGQAPSTGWVVASGRRRTRTPALARPAGFKPGATARRLHLPERRADYSKATPCDAHPLATEPGSPVRFTLPAYPSSDSNRDHLRPEHSASIVGLEGHGVSDGARTRSTSMASSRAADNTSLTCEPSVRFELTASPVPRARSIRWSYEGVCWPTWARTRVPASKVRWAALP
jgi:hypothetical protein